MVIIFYPLNRIFKENNALAGMVAVAVTLLIEYGFFLIGFDPSNYFYGILDFFNLNSDITLLVMGVLLTIGFLFIIFKFGFTTLIFVIGCSLILFSFTDYVYQKNTAFVIGVLLVLLSWYFYRRRKKREMGIIGPGYVGRTAGWMGRKSLGAMQYGSRKWKVAQRAKNIQRIRQERLAREAAERQRQAQEQQNKQQKLLEYKEQKMIEDKRSRLKELTREYNRIQRDNPSDPRLREIIAEIKRLKRE
jgi:LPXTG-motif cell wall-anchored protein